MTVIGATPPTATRAEPGDMMIGNFAVNGVVTTDIDMTGLRRSNASYEIESITNDVNLKTNGIVGVQLSNNGDFSVHTSAQFTKKSNGFTGFGTVSSANRVGISGGLAVGSGYIGTAAPTNGAIFEGGIGVGTSSPVRFVECSHDTAAEFRVESVTSGKAFQEIWGYNSQTNEATGGASGGGILILRNKNTTDGNWQSLSFQNSNGQAVGSILSVNTSHASRHGALLFQTHNGSALVSGLRIDKDGVNSMPVYGAGTATFSAAGAISSVSDKNAKVDDGGLTVEQAYKSLNSIEPRFFFMKDSDGGTLTGERHLGFYAQDVHKELPEAAPHSYQEDYEGNVTKDTWGIYDRSIISMQHVVIKDLKKRIEFIENQ